MTTLTESNVESAAPEWLAAFGWQVAHGPAIAPVTPVTPGAEPDRLPPKLVSAEIKVDGGLLD